MKSFVQFFLEYRHKLATGDAAPSIQANNNKNPNNVLQRKHKNSLRQDYKELNPKAHIPGTVFVGQELINLLADYSMEFKDGHTHQVKSSPWGLQMYYDPQGQPTAKVIQTKPLATK